MLIAPMSIRPEEDKPEGREQPFDVLVEGLDLSQSRGDRTGFELFIDGIRLWEPETRFLLNAKA